MLKLHNSLSRALEELKPLDEQNIRIYSCGPTLYDHAHIGNLSSYIFADTLQRVIAVTGKNVTHVMNYTDVDDKTIRRSLENHPVLKPREALEKLTTHYAELFLDDMKKIGNDINAMTFVRATDHIESMKQLITRLHEQGFAYVADDGVYFSIEAYRKSGKTYGQLLTLDPQNTSQERIHNDEYDKESAHDFALWKKQKDSEPAWKFSLDNQDLSGRPGWHIECSAMSRQILGQPFDIHTGGVDLIFPHHENEIAQSTASEENPSLATMFVHNEHLLVDGKKMAKSANNFYTLDDIIKKGYDPLAFRLLVLQSHYRHQAHFSWENLQAAQNRLNNLRAFADLRWQINKANPGTSMQYDTVNIFNQLEDDMNTPAALARISQDIDSGEIIFENNKDSFVSYVKLIDHTFGLKLNERHDISSEQKEILAKREEARQTKDWAKSDELRDVLKQQGIGVRDTDHGPIWFREAML